MTIKYPELTGEIAKRGIKKCVLASTLGISGRALRNKMSGNTPFTWPEVCTVQERFFPDVDKDTLFRKSNELLPLNGNQTQVS